MRNLLLVLLLSLPAMGLPTPDEVVSKIYRTHLKAQDMRKTVAQNPRCFTPEFQALLQKSLSKPSVDFDIFTHSKESLSDFEVAAVTQQATQAQVQLELWLGGRPGQQKGQPQRATVYLINLEGGAGFQVEEIQYPTRPRFKISEFLRSLADN